MPGNIALMDDGKLAFVFPDERGILRRKVIFGLEGEHVMFLHPRTKQEVRVGLQSRTNGLLIAIFGI